MEQDRASDVPPAKKRRRPTVVCTNCKRRKSKCDRLKPVCGNCLRLGDETTCAYGLEPAGEARKPGVSRLVAQCFEMVRSTQPTLIDLQPNGVLIQCKRSCTSYIAPLTPSAAKQRDPYLQALGLVCQLKRTMRAADPAPKKEGTAEATSRGSLPNSMRYIESIEQNSPEQPASLASRHKKMCRQLFTKFGKYRRNHTSSTEDDLKALPSRVPAKKVFFRHIWPYFWSHLSGLCPIFDEAQLEKSLKRVYDRFSPDTHSKLDVEDYACFSIVLLITCLVQLSLKFAQDYTEENTNSESSIVMGIDTSKFISMVNDCISRKKGDRKCSLLRLQSLLLLRFYHWCAPDDGDGDYLQHSNMLMGKIVAACYSMGIEWQCVRDPEEFVNNFNLCLGLMPLEAEYDASDYKKIWTTVLHWDRKLSLLTGQRCLIGNSIKLPTPGHESPSCALLKFDSLILKICDMISNDPRRVDATAVIRLLETLRQSLKKDTRENIVNTALGFEWGMVIALLELTITHAHMVHSEKTESPDEFCDCIQGLFEKVLQITKICEQYLYSQEGLDPSARFYTNKIVDIAFSSISAIFPSLILRSGRSIEPHTKTTLLNFYRDILSASFNTIGVEYYSCFRRMFPSKLVFRTLSAAGDEDPWTRILEFIVSSDYNKEFALLQRSGIFKQFFKSYEKTGNVESAASLWSAYYAPNDLYSFDLDVKSFGLQMPFSHSNRYNDYDVFEAFFNNAKTLFLAKVPNLPALNGTALGQGAFNYFDYSLLQGIENFDSADFLDFFEPGGSEALVELESQESPSNQDIC
ncbi:Oleate activated transcription factor 3 [Lachancea thermotolerans]